MHLNIKIARQFIAILPVLFCHGVFVLGQGPGRQLSSSKPNYTSFTIKYRRPEKIAIPGPAADLPADAGFVDKIVPSANADEVYSKRTMNSKYYINKDTPSIYFMAKSLGALHYKKNGQWLTIDPRLEPAGSGIFEASHLQEPLGFDVKRKVAYVRSAGGIIFFNNWTLYGVKAGSSFFLAHADWSHHTVGDDGILISNIFPGIDAEMRVFRFSVKTNFIVHSMQFPGFQQYVFKDRFSGKEKGGLVFTDLFSARRKASAADYLVNREKILHIHKAFMYGEKDPADGYHALDYTLNQQQLSLIVPTGELGRLLEEGDAIIDPLVSIVNSIDEADILGSRFNPDCSFNQTCDYPLTMPSQAGAQVIDVRFSFTYLSSPPCTGKDGSFNIELGDCVSKGWTSNAPNQAGTWGADAISIFSDIDASCFPPPSCSSQEMNFMLQFARTCKGNQGCDGECIGAISPFTILVEGQMVIDIPIVKIDASAATICRGNSITLNARTTNGGATPAFQWLVNGMSVGTNDSVFTSSSWSDLDSVRCVLTSSLITGCATNNDTSTLIVIHVDEPPSMHILASSTDICAGDPVTFSGSSANEGDLPVYQWQVNGTDVGTNAPTYTSGTLKNGDSVTAVLKASTTCNNPVRSDNRIDITVREVPVITPGHDRVIGLGDSVRLDPLVSGNIASYLWSPAAGLLDSRILNPVARPVVTSTYKLDVMAVSGCEDSTTLTIKVLKPFNMPNAFTPNQDGRNDLFRVPASGLLSLKEFSVYNRWGTRIFYTNDPGKGWDGTFLGQPCDPGVYVYMVEGNGLHGQIFLKGTVSLIR